MAMAPPIKQMTASTMTIGIQMGRPSSLVAPGTGSVVLEAVAGPSLAPGVMVGDESVVTGSYDDADSCAPDSSDTPPSALLSPLAKRMSSVSTTACAGSFSASNTRSTPPPFWRYSSAPSASLVAVTSAKRCSCTLSACASAGKFCSSCAASSPNTPMSANVSSTAAHAFSLHTRSSTLDTSSPQLSAGTTRFLVCTPPPHATEHAVH
mmetsp:Transcript_6374/g.11056  ORF Transcript_6374/g.11056 Transcript_6374/m.11056 type:complete len:208 (+) Transcript_6374:387-1010(+)